VYVAAAEVVFGTVVSFAFSMPTGRLLVPRSLQVPPLPPLPAAMYFDCTGIGEVTAALITMCTVSPLMLAFVPILLFTYNRVAQVG
jgi:hypothetical protein